MNRATVTTKKFYIKAGDRSPALPVQVVQEDDNTVLDLTGSTSVFNMKDLSSGSAVVSSSAATVTAPALGKVEYRWGANDTVTPGTYKAEFVITLSDGTTTTVPASGYIQVEILQRLA